MCCAQAEVSAKPKGDVGIRLAVEPHLFRRRKDVLVQVGRCPTERGPVAGLDQHAIDVSVNRTDSSNVRERHVGPEKLLARVHDTIGVGP